ncbi:MAG: hypothetical protein IMF01_10645 [Proteobacteria bacterium]|nr:hypothetical protein [Pseudomonadota bacterium]
MSNIRCDLHSSNNNIGIMDQDYKRLFGRRQLNDLNHVLKVLEPFKADLEGVIVGSTYNWYWLVDGLHEYGEVFFLLTRPLMGNQKSLKC